MSRWKFEKGTKGSLRGLPSVTGEASTWRAEKKKTEKLQHTAGHILIFQSENTESEAEELNRWHATLRRWYFSHKN